MMRFTTITMSALNRQVAIAAVVVVCCSILVTVVSSCEPERTRFGCRIHESECLCGTGCDLQYRYLTRQECTAALRGRAKDPCSRNPCKNEGLCTQKSEHPGFNCHCASTGYHGPRCEHKCPVPKRGSGLPQNFPFDCIII